MAGLPPLRYLRKSSALLTLIFLFFLIHRFSAGWNQDSAVPDSPEQVPLAESVTCRNIVGGAPFGIDSVFESQRTRVYVVSALSEKHPSPQNPLLHVWYQDGSVIQVDTCQLAGNHCASSIAPEKLSIGGWSVDFVRGRRLLSTRQFQVQDNGP